MAPPPLNRLHKDNDMYLDTLNEFSDKQAVTATAISTKVVDLGPAPRDVGTGEPLYLVVACDETFNNLDSLTVALESSDAAGLTSSTVHVEKTVAAADLTAGKVLLSVALPAGDYKRNLGMRYTVAGAAPTAGKVSAALVKDRQAWRAYPAATGF